MREYYGYHADPAGVKLVAIRAAHLYGWRNRQAVGWTSGCEVRGSPGDTDGDPPFQSHSALLTLPNLRAIREADAPLGDTVLSP